MPCAQQDGAQVLTLDELHGDELDAVGFVQVVNADDVPVRDLPGQHQLLLEARQNGGIAGEVGTNDLQADHALHFHVAGFVDRAHAAHAEHFLDLVAAAEDIAFAEDGCADVGERSDAAARTNFPDGPGLPGHRRRSSTRQTGCSGAATTRNQLVHGYELSAM